MKYIGLFITSLITISASAQTTVKQDAGIKQMVEEVSSKKIEAIVRKLVSFKTRHTLSDTVSKTEGVGAARNWIKAEYEKYAAASNGRMKVSFDEFIQPQGSRIDKPTPMKNVLAILKGTDTADKRIYIISGHYDSRVTDVMNVKSFAPGAVDDASGTAVSMELARVMAKRSFPATIIFMAVVGEEQGLYGSTNVAKRAKAEGWQIDAMLNNDIVGNTFGMETGLKDNRSVRVFSEGVPAAETEKQAAIRNSVGGENDSPARELARYTKEVAERYVEQLDVKLIYRRDRYLRGGDHTPFSQQGYTAIRITEMNEDFNRQHQDIRKENGVEYGDLPDFADYDYTQKVARMNLSVLANLALAPASPQNVGIITSGLTNKTQLKWDASKGKAPAGYYVLMRETSSPYWEKKFYVPGTTANIGYSKDNYLFAVQAVDAEGHESLPVFPKPVR
ncbi:MULTISPECIES: M20/M25/M40 family metallo-hydrolase [unclassified Mucilaginibacter]|uniref:M20/M25/M40 family metallo-hydrolase n=1 Tax=unclassified Mucilaginibacter TaxID=2617802 RepID=UPI002AC8D03E|nr:MULTISPECIES: M20/M25/M40 family metallo-hydrolase [unclassified Mucilaginibacter]MEB0263040.1 M20/M25/M40 family metallo-hydrolase [Mucilaginibacter sp. 10I4]MEB0277914.1 M20/M25/M40 family metallo-hydrolase [Mucilaginibacter sp. 10B2]MEB0301996.1 M20/M25/M40 family metallo-hydrolase [Mucilaginibacter sp. 5C4]WPX22805.1 M20/M25/M40 family metallo-hydrolase [Mucilaginibacter sp. 5C4]